MPISLIRESRRQFLMGTAAAIALSTRRSLALNAVDNVARTKGTWAIFSDTHLSADKTKVRAGGNIADRLARALAEVEAAPERPEGLILSGDCAHADGRVDDYQSLATALRGLVDRGAPAHLLLGNHDHRQNMIEGIGSVAPSPFPPTLQRRVAMIPGERFDFFLIDSLDVTNQTTGLLGADQLAWLDQSLQRRSPRPAVVVGHHNLTDSAGLLDGAKTVVPSTTPRSAVPGLRDSKDFLTLLRSRPQVIAYLFGHTHQLHAVQLDGLTLFNLPAVGYPFNPKEPTGWTLLESKSEGLSLTFRCFDAGHPSAKTAITIPWKRERAKAA